MSEGKVQLNGGFGVVYDDGKLIIHNTDNTSCCCGTDPPEPPDGVCLPKHWKDYGLGYPPPDALFQEDISENKVPRCITVTIQGGAFDGQYGLYWNGDIFKGRYAIIAQEDQQFNGWLYENGEFFPDILVPVAGLYSGHQYEVQISIGFDAAGDWSCNLAISQFSNGGLTDRVSGFTGIVAYDGINFFDQLGSIKSLAPYLDSTVGGAFNSALPSDLNGGWLMFADFTNSGSEVSDGSHDNHNCECFHPRYINSADQRVSAGQNNALDFTWHNVRRVTDGFGVVFSELNRPLEATGFQDIPSLSILSGDGASAYLEGDNSRYAEELIARRYYPMVRGQGYVWECTFNTAVFLRNGTAAIPNFGMTGYFPCSYDMSSNLPFVDGEWLKLTRHFQVNRNTFGSNPTTDMEALSYWTCNFPSAHTETVPTADSILSPYDTCLPSTTTIKYVWEWMDYKCVDQGVVCRPEFRYQIIINGALVRSGVECSVGFETWWQLLGRGLIELTIDNSPVWRQNPDIWDQFTEGFDDDVKGGMSSTSFYPTSIAPYWAPEYCPSVPPKILMTPQGEIDDVGHNHEITFHLGEDIGQHKAYDANGYMQGNLLIKGAPSNDGIPPGLSLSDDGVLSGTPTTEGVWSLYRRIQDEVGNVCFSWTLTITVKVRNPEFQYDPQGFTSGGTNDQGVDWYMRDGDSGTIEANAHWGTTPYVMSYTGDALDGASFNTSTGDWTLNPAHTQVGNTSGTVTMKLLDDTNKTDYVTKTWFRLGGTPPI